MPHLLLFTKDFILNFDSDGSAVDCAHYIGGDGVLNFEPGENKKDILIPIMNDSNGGRNTFTVELGAITGPAELGANEKTTVHIDNVAGAYFLSSSLFAI